MKDIYKLLIILLFLGFISYSHYHRGSVIARGAETGEVETEGADDGNVLTAALANVLTNIGQSNPPAQASYSPNTPQFVVFSFDGSKSIEMLDETLAFARKMNMESKPLHFTYFINAVYFLTNENASFYTAPGHQAGASAIGFSNASRDIVKRVRSFNTALAEGHEIGSHAVGHYNGKDWTYEQWKQEFISFNTILADVQKNNPSVAIEIPNFGEKTIMGFRAPNLGVNDNMYKELADANFVYDTSGVGNPKQWPVKNAHGTWLIPLGIVHIGTNRVPVISMDYSLWVHQSQAKEVAVKGSPLWQKYFDELYQAYMEYFNINYNGNRAPVIIANHFSKWNDGVYWEALKAVAEEVCGKPDVRCVGFKDLVQFLNTDTNHAVSI